MLLKELIKCLTKYYVVFIASGSSRYEDQTAVPNQDLEKEVETIDFYEDDGDGEMLLVNLSD